VSTYLLKTFPDCEGGVRDWLRSVPSVSALVGQRVFFGLPVAVTWPAVVVQMVGGGPDAGNAPVFVPLIQIDCWGEGRNKAQAAAVMSAVVGAIESIQSGTALGADAKAVWASVLSVIWLPDPESDQARYSVTAEIAARAV
jgi:hypothetical protein